MMFATSSQDNTSKLIITTTLETIKTYVSAVPLNSVSICPTKNHIITGGGISARDVTTTFYSGATFDIDFHHLIFEEKIGKVKGHFGPINALRYSPDGKGFTSGGEDGIVKIFTNFSESEYSKIKDFF
jgi:translation initiation factor 3 subunit I